MTPLLDSCLFFEKNAADNLKFGTAAKALDQLRQYADNYEAASESEFLTTQFEMIDEYQENLNKTAKNNPSNLTFSIENYTLDDTDKPQNPNIT